MSICARDLGEIVILNQTVENHLKRYVNYPAKRYHPIAEW
jgi:hypothetical protein